MYNQKIVSSFLRREGLYPQADRPEDGGLRLRLEREQLLLEGAPEALIELADLLVSLALSGEARGQHWHIDTLTLLDASSEILEWILSRN